MADEPARQWLYHFRPGERPELARDANAWTEDDDRIAAAHVAYLRQATADGIVILAGRCQDGIGPAVVIFEAPDVTAARAFMEADPFVRHGLFGADLHPFRAAFMRE